MREQNGAVLNEDHVLLFDGVCILCNRLVNFIIKRDKKTKIRFISLQSESGQALLGKYGIPDGKLDSVVYIRRGKYYLKSSAILLVFRDMGGVWVLFFAFIIIPGFIRDFIYKIIAKTRYRVFGRQESCHY